ncbi:sulfatase-like hydrolase/transferase [Haloarchaeobius amylolyticus]|uniref:sulfatase-like hydrolase/transferase n=1 Tax=Haloarchaeobius amylolyticus TaxID=1198296 RepID=UPI002271F770|nr:sulfatase-like hydrolase/transferase [Haloarchaeobius amylolyticus]
MSINNVYIFAADALRDDYLPDSVKEVGEYVPTVSSGTISPEGFSSIVSGLYPYQHQTHAFTNRLEPRFNYLNAVAETYDTRFFQIYNTELAKVLGMEQDTSNPVESLEEPFIVLERDMTTHAPYNYSSYKDIDVGPQEYFGGKNVEWSRIRSDYEAASKQVGERFRQRLDELDSAGLLDETLVIFTSDHGELLGEYSEQSHGDPLVPELVEVPTVIRCPDSSSQPVVPEFMSHVDILPTIIDALDEEKPWTMPGDSVFTDGSPPYRLCEHRDKPHSLEEFSFQNYYDQNLRSVWDANGGVVFNETSVPGLGVHAFRQAPLFNPLRGRDVFRAFGALYHHLRPTRTFGDPGFTPSEAREYIQEIDDLSIRLSKGTEEISEEAREELEHLGYL